MISGQSAVGDRIRNFVANIDGIDSMQSHTDRDSGVTQKIGLT